MESLHERDRVGVQDSVLLDDFHNEAAFVENLRKRFRVDLIYTYIGTVLVSVNPYKPLKIYGPKTIEEYQNIHMFERPPHIFAIADAAYRSLTEEGKNQCVLISGESGSGKTEASKKILEYVAAVSNHKGQVVVVKDKLLKSNPVLEAFGNAKTNRNNNSSRFGKYMDIQFDGAGDPVGGNILNYLLEKSRVIQQNKGERNFHIFYQLLSGGSDELLKSLSLTRNPKEYSYLSNTDKVTSTRLRDADQMKEVLAALHTMGLSAKDQQEIMAIVASVLHLGNVGIVETDGTAKLTNTQYIENAAQLLGCDVNELSDALLQRTIKAQEDSVTSLLNRELAVYARDALAKAIYDRLFTWLVSRLNKSLQPRNKRKIAVMGILDIYGFEIFEQNSFEQFCINYCNEKLQQVFIELTLKSEQEEYLKEGVEWETVEYFNNNIICDLIEERHKGIIAILDEECLRPGKASDKTFLEKLGQQLSSHEHFVCHKKADVKMQKLMSREEFKLVHYAGDVVYNVNGFIEKNKDLLYRDLRQVMSETTNSITQSVFPKSDLDSKKRPDTAITQFKASLNQLMQLLMVKTPSYIRCIKPNDEQAGGIFEQDIVAHQVKYLGLMENLRVRRAGFAYRRKYEDFLKRYKCLCPTTWPKFRGTDKEGVGELLKHLGYSNECRMGNTKLFIRFAKTLFEIEDAFQIRKVELVVIIQSYWRGYMMRKRFVEMRAASIVIQSWVRRYRAQKLAKRRRRAVKVVRDFIEGYITRGGPVTELNKGFIQTAKQQYLLRLAKSLPKSVISHAWPVAPTVCAEASRHLQVMHRLWLARNYCKALSPEKRKQFELKLLAESLFKGKKKSYQQSIGPWFVDSRLSDTQNIIKTNFLATGMSPGERLVYSSYVFKFDRHGYKRRDRILMVTDQAINLIMEDGKRFKVKHRLEWECITKLEITSEKDNFLLIRICPYLTKDKGDLILEVPNLVEAVTKIVSITDNPEMVNINSLENGVIVHTFSNGKTGLIDLKQGTNGTGVTKGKSGQLIVVG